MEAAECGAAALGIILEYHGRYVPPDVLRDECGVSRDGSNALYIKEAAKQHGLEVKAFRKEAEGLVNRRPPFIVFWESNHFLVVEGFRGRRVYLNDPAVGRRTVSLDEFRRSYSGIAFTFERGPRFEKRGGRPGALAGLAARLSRSRVALAFVILAGLALAIPDLAAAALQRVYVDGVLIEGHADWLRPLLIAVAATAIMRLAASGLQQVHLTRLEVRLTLAESLGFLRHALQLPLAFFQRRFAGDIVTRAWRTARVARLISGELATTVVSLLTLVLYVALMLPYDASLTVMGVAISGFNLVALRSVNRFRVDRNRAIEQLRARLTGGVMWAIQIIESIKATGSEKDLLVRWTGDQARMINAEQELGACDALLIALPPLLSSLTTILVLGLGGRQVMMGSISIGALVAFQSLLVGFNQPFRDLARLGSDIQELRADLDRIDDVRHREIDPVFRRPRIGAGETSDNGSAAVPRRLSGQVEFRGVTFGYNRTIEEPLIKDLSFAAAPGQRIALVGSSGSGKSTIGRLLAGLYQPWSGQILYDGRPLDRIPREVFVDSVALVDAEICLFEGTVRDNLSLWDELLPMERLVRASMDAAIHRDLLRRRGGYGAAVAEQARNFSGGQRQRLQIARALVRDPSLVILDEATSALDPRTERIVDDNLRRRGCTCLIIAHRLTTIRDCDEIIVLSGGHVVQRGTHDELIADEQGEYARLVSHQALPGQRSAGRPSRSRSRSRAQALAALRAELEAVPVPETAPARLSMPAVTGGYEAAVALREPARFLVEELLPFSRPERTSANMPLELDDPAAVWLVNTGSVDVFFTLMEPGAAAGRRRHLCRVDEGGSIFAIRGVRGRTGGGLVAVGAGPAELLKFSRGDLIRLSFEEGLTEQVALLLDDWLYRVGRALAHSAGAQPCAELRRDVEVPIEAGTRFSVRGEAAWVRHLGGTSRLLDQVALPDNEFEARFPLTEPLWLTADGPCRVTACGTRVVIHSGDPWAGLDAFHRAVLDYITDMQEREASARWSEVVRSRAYEAEVLESVSAQLAAAAGVSGMATAVGGSDLLSACRAVGESLGIEVLAPRPSAEGETLPSEHELGTLARASGFHTRPVTLREGWWRRGGEPLLGVLSHAEGRRVPVALLPAVRRRPWSAPGYEVRMPDGRSCPVDRRVAGSIERRAWLFYRPLPDRRLGMGELFAFCRELRGLPRELALVLTTAFGGALLGLSIPIASGILVDQVIPEADVQGIGGPGLSRLAVMCGFLAILALATSAFQAIQSLMVLRIEGRISGTLIPAVWERLLRLPSRFFAGFSSGDLALRAMGLSEVFKRASGAVVTSIVTGVFSLFNLALLYAYSWRLALITTMLLGLLLLVTTVLLAGRLRFESSIGRIDGSLSGLLLELFGGMITLRSSGAEGRALARWAARYGERLRLLIRSRRLSNAVYQWLAVFPILTAIVVYTGVVHVDPGLMNAGRFLAFNMAFANLVAAVLAGCYTSIAVLDMLPLCQRIRPILEESPEVPAAVIEPVRLAGALALNRVSFRYAGQDPGERTLDDVSLQVRPGEFVAIVGPSGSGKSTIMRLLLGFEGPDSGTVTYDGRELAMLDLREVRRQIGVVLQHAQLMPSDIYSNIVGFAPSLGVEDAWHAARLAGLEDDIRAMPMGMHTLVGEAGGNLSSGQRQRLLIARAIVHRPRILLLDEATSALDNVTQSIVSDSLTNQLRDVTRLVIAHRLDAIIKADRIYVLKEGRIVQSGRYDQLLAEAGPFRELARRQML
jgi:NHLM bacteriocin system ABC transporter peptidase/ATP-binding protein/NHLM bacteriocin system ABC transporter ATP-binding protein